MNEKDSLFSAGDSSSIQSRRFDFDRALNESGLPTVATECVRRVMSKLRLWRGERADVAAELIAHFVDGIEAGRSIEELLANFGDPSRTAALITRAKKRQRGWRWRSLQVLGATGIAIVVFYSVVTYRFYSSKAEPKVDYVAVLNSKAKSVPANERAYPLYVEALAALKPLKPLTERFRHDLLNTTPEDKKWSDVVAILEQCAPVIETTREAARKSGMGHLLADVRSNETPPLVLNAAYHMDGDFVTLERVLRFDAISAADKGNASVAAADIEAQLRMAEHLGETPLLLYGMLALTADSNAFQTTDIILFRYPDLFDHAQLRRLARLTAAHAIAMTPYWEGEYLFYQDVIQRIYTDDGHGNGRLAADLTSILREFEPINSRHTWWQKVGTSAFMPLAGLSAPDRRSALGVFREYYDLTIANSISPSNNPDARINTLRRQLPSFIFGTAALSTRSNNDYAVSLESDRQALLVALGLELYRREEGAWPSTIDALAPRFIPSIPTDRVSRQPLHFRIEHNRPIVFAAGRPAGSAENILWPPDSIRPWLK